MNSRNRRLIRDDKIEAIVFAPERVESPRDLRSDLVSAGNGPNSEKVSRFEIWIPRRIDTVCPRESESFDATNGMSEFLAQPRTHFFTRFRRRAVPTDKLLKFAKVFSHIRTAKCGFETSDC